MNEDLKRLYEKCSKLIGGYMNHGGELKTRVSSTLKDDNQEIISLIHPEFGEIQLRINADKTVRILADQTFNFDFVGGKGRIIEVEYFGHPYED